jgi:acyl-coenzyme A synthetase/AMP-(fatty) acid ligase
MLHYPEELEQQLKDADRVVLISSPAFLSRTASEPLWQQYKDCLTMVFSSGGPLQQATANSIAEQTGQAPVEVLGSTETGGIAWRRQQHQPPHLWQPFDSVEIKLEDDSQRLILKSPYLFVAGWYLTDDRIEITADGKFELLGRFDRVVKIEEKRLSLDELEQQLLTHPYVQQCKAIVLTGKRTTIGCAVELTHSGKAVYSQQDKRMLNETLKGHLSQYFEAVQLPRKWRYLDLMPCNSQGKIQQQQIAQLFEN